MTLPRDGFLAGREMPHLGAQMKAYTAELQSEVDNLWTQLAPMRDSWLGEGANAYDLCQTRWNAVLGQMAKSFESGGMVVQLAHAEYNATDLRNASNLTF
ncbi:WXG100 family type VII secretion target [Lentzea alba]|uniref:WXG100 family type VII secretion target n=1 Tax=Lentzea alba TaxID=2714351 RepID=UPI0039BF95A6